MTHENLPMAGGGCTCGAQSSGLPELDARLIPQQVRHGAVMGAVSSLRPGQAVALIAPHDPVPLLKQMRANFGESLTVEYLEQGPEQWKVKLGRV